MVSPAALLACYSPQRESARFRDTENLPSFPDPAGSAVDNNDDSDDSWVPADDDAPSSQQQQCIKHPAASACVGKEAGELCLIAPSMSHFPYQGRAFSHVTFSNASATATMTVSDDEDQPLAKQEGGSAAAANGAQDQEGDNAIAAVDDLSTDAAPSSKPASHAPSPFDERVLDTTDDDGESELLDTSNTRCCCRSPNPPSCGRTGTQRFGAGKS